jgi:uncharacterized protein (DUF1800 family)
VKPFTFLGLVIIYFLSSLDIMQAQEPRLSNISCRAITAQGANVLTAGFVIGNGANKQILIRAVGPTLASYGVTGTLSDPLLTLFDGNGKAIASNDNWIASDSTTFDSVGAFKLPIGSKDSALVITLPPGNYSAQAAGANGTSGAVIIEVYEVGNSTSKLINLSTRLQVTQGSTPIVGFVVSNGTGTRKMLIRAAGPALIPFGVTGTLADPALKLTTSTGAVIASNDNWSVPTDSKAVDANIMANAFIAAGAFSYTPNSKDAAVLVDLSPGLYGVQLSSTVASNSGVAIVEAYDLTPSELPTVTLTASKPNSDQSGLNPGEFTLTRTGPTFMPLSVNYGIGGSATNGTDYPLLSGSVVFPTGVSTITIPLNPNPEIQAKGTVTAVLTLLSSADYSIGAKPSATVSISDSPSNLYITSLRPSSLATGGSTASGTATIMLSSTGVIASVTVSYSNLSSAEVSAHLTLGSNEDYLFNLGTGQVNGKQWTITPTGNYSVADIVSAIKSGNVSVRIDTVNYPSGEVKGSFIKGVGQQTFTVPSAAPSISLTNVTATDAARFLTQATFGPKKSEIDALTGGSIDTWITNQMAKPATSHRAAIQYDRTTYGGSGSFSNWNAVHPPNRQSSWFKVAITADDQLRQRVAFALSQIFVVSDVSLGEDSQSEPLAYYYDLLVNGAFGNFRTLLENVTLSPVMGLYLSALRNSKADPVTGQTPDENYAREVMQLFTIGLVKLQPDGTLLLGADGLTVPTYNQTTITQMAKVFTGWAYPSTNLASFRTASTNYYSPMQLFPAYHDDTAKDLTPVTTTTIAANQGGTKDLQLALDALFNHPNTAPFISKLLIQRLVTSNPSPAYVYRVAQKFENNGFGVRGDLAAVVRAILTDYEARSPVVASNITFGKLKEPILRLTALLRGFSASSTSGRYMGYRVTVNGTPIVSTTPKPAAIGDISTIYSSTRLDAVQSSINEAPLRSPTVFNYYHADYVLPGPVAEAGLVVPEFEITDDNYAINVPNVLRTFANATLPATTADPYTVTLNLDYEKTLASNPAALTDYLSTILCANSLSTAARSSIIATLTALQSTSSADVIVRTALILITSSPNAAIQR